MQIIEKRILIELPSKKGKLQVSNNDERKGVVKIVGADIDASLLGKTVKYSEYPTGERFTEDGVEYQLCKYEDIIIIY